MGQVFSSQAPPPQPAAAAAKKKVPVKYYLSCDELDEVLLRRIRQTLAEGTLESVTMDCRRVFDDGRVSELGQVTGLHKLVLVF